MNLVIDLSKSSRLQKPVRGNRDLFPSEGDFKKNEEARLGARLVFKARYSNKKGLGAYLNP
jgi:hypothetical protein